MRRAGPIKLRGQTAVRTPRTEQLIDKYDVLILLPIQSVGATRVGGARAIAHVFRGVLANSMPLQREPDHERSPAPCPPRGGCTGSRFLPEGPFRGASALGQGVVAHAPDRLEQVLRNRAPPGDDFDGGRHSGNHVDFVRLCE